MMTREADEERLVAVQSLLAKPPLERPGIVILPAKSDPSLTLSGDRDAASGPAPDDHYLKLGGHGGPEPLWTYTFGRKNGRIIVSGQYEFHDSGTPGTRTYEIISARAGPAAPELAEFGNRNLTRAEYDLSVLVPYFDTFNSRGIGVAKPKTIVVDARDEYITKWSLLRAIYQPSPEELRRRLLANLGKDKS